MSIDSPSKRRQRESNEADAFPVRFGAYHPPKVLDTTDSRSRGGYQILQTVFTGKAYGNLPWQSLDWGKPSDDAPLPCACLPPPSATSSRRHSDSLTKCSQDLNPRVASKDKTGHVFLPPALPLSVARRDKPQRRPFLRDYNRLTNSESTLPNVDFAGDNESSTSPVPSQVSVSAPEQLPADWWTVEGLTDILSREGHVIAEDQAQTSGKLLPA